MVRAGKDLHWRSHRHMLARLLPKDDRESPSTPYTQE
jgi:hypothetical protein